jgi:hypothetical protein
VYKCAKERREVIKEDLSFANFVSAFFLAFFWFQVMVTTTFEADEQGQSKQVRPHAIQIFTNL